MAHSNIAPDGSVIDETKSGSGHTYQSVNKSMGALVMMVLFMTMGITAYMAYRVYFQRKYFTQSWLTEYGKKGAKESEDQISRDIPKELNESAASRRGLPTDVYQANINSKRELVP